jgi:putative hydrolase of the HAD superfamily
MHDLLVLSFDLDDTLWPITPVILQAESRMWQWLKTNHPELMHSHSIETVRAVRAQVALDFPKQAHDMSFLRHRAIMRLFGEHSRAEAYADAAFEVFFAARNEVTLYPEAEACLSALRTRYRVFALSNGNADLARCGVAHLFDGHVSAISAGVSKPDPRIFAQLVHEAGVSPHQVLHIGDDPYTDVQGAAAAGLRNAWLNRDGKIWPADLPPPHRTLSTLTELL